MLKKDQAFELRQSGSASTNLSTASMARSLKPAASIQPQLMTNTNTFSFIFADAKHCGLSKSMKSGEMKLFFVSLLLLWYLSNHGVSGVGADEVSVSVMEGDSVTLYTGVQTNQQDRIRWYYNDILIAQINRDQSKVCTDVQCNEDTERFRDRLKLDHQTGSLTITNTRKTDAGDYKLKIISSRDSEKIFSVTVHGAISVSPHGESVFVKEGDSVTLHTGVQTNQQDRIRWYYNDSRIAEINGDLSKICTDVQCEDGDERFRDRLKLDHQTGSLTITDTTNTDSGEYTLKISGSDSEKLFSVSVRGVSAADRDEVKRKSVMEGESVTLDPGVMNPNYSMTWYYNDVLMAEITGDQSQICTDDQCKERFRDRLKLDHQTGSLTIMNINTTDTGDYKLKINSSRISIIRSFSVSVTDYPDSGLSSGLSSAAVAGIVVAVLVGAAVAAIGAVYCYRRCKKKGTRKQPNSDHPQGNNVLEEVPLNQTDPPQEAFRNGMSTNQTDAPQEAFPNGTSTTGTDSSLMAADNDETEPLPL